MSAKDKLSRTQVNLLGAWVDPVSQEEALGIILSWCKNRARQFVVTPNLDHCRMMRTNGALAAACEVSGMSIPDGWPLVMASRMTKYKIKQRVTGSDLVIPLCRLLAKNDLSVFLLGSSPEALKACAKKLRDEAPGLILSGMYSPPFGFEQDPQNLTDIKERIMKAQPDALLVALGSPKQELWMASQVTQLPIGVAIGVGGSLDFLAGKQKRAPKAVQNIGLEWLWRALSNPRRLGKRYLIGIAIFPVLVLSHIRRHLITKRNAVRHRLL